METIICLIRHGQTDWNKQKLIQGRINNPLNEEGINQVREVGLILKEKDPEHFSGVRDLWLSIKITEQPLR